MGGLISVLSDLIVAGAAAAAVWVAYQGLETWRRELRGRTEYELARRTLRLVYQIRDGIRIVRNPGMSAAEFSDREGYDSSALTATPEDLAHAYEKRWSRVAEPMIELEAAFLEAEVLWGTLLGETVSKLRGETRKLQTAIVRYLRLKREPPAAAEESWERRAKIEATIWEGGNLDSDRDALSDSVNEAVEAFEHALKPKLAR